MQSVTGWLPPMNVIKISFQGINLTKPVCLSDVMCEFLKIHNNNKEILILRHKMPKQTQRRWSLHIGKMHDQHLEAFPFAGQGTILNSHRVMGIATNTSNGTKLHLGESVTYIMMTADVELPDAV